MAFWFIIFPLPWVISLAIPTTAALAIPSPLALENAHSDHIGPILPQLKTRDWNIIMTPRDSDLGLAALAGVLGMVPGSEANVLKTASDGLVPVLSGQEITSGTETESEPVLANEESFHRNFIADIGEWKVVKRWRSWIWGPEWGSNGEADLNGLERRIPPKAGSPYLHCTGQRTAPLCCAMEKGEDVGCESPAIRPNDVMHFIKLCGDVHQAARCCTVTIHGYTCEEPNGRLHYKPGQCDKTGLLGLCID